MMGVIFDDVGNSATTDDDDDDDDDDDILGMVGMTVTLTSGHEN